ncbi:hypothetical protein GGR56DRAFT_661070 [Xylariaceae sp. FL0804]|nr:hypothetical protein GGR56DRAFT_661070 [Xylariaceae sp. FL0804]
MALAGLLRMPYELIIHVTSYLDRESYADFRLCCKHVEDVLFTAFAREYFFEVQVMRTEASLQQLIDISTSRLSPFVQRVALRSDFLNGEDAYYSLESLESVEGRLSRYNTRMQYVDQQIFCGTGEDRRMLAQAFRHLNLDIAGICDYKPKSRQRPNTRYRPVPGGHYDIRLRDPNSPDTAALCFHTLLFALADAGARPGKLEAMFQRPAMRTDAFRLPPSMEQSIVPILAQLQELHLEFSQERAPYNMRPVAFNYGGRCDISTHYLRSFLGHATGLRFLHLKLGGIFDKYEGFVAWMASPPDSESSACDPRLRPPPPVAFPFLTHLELCSADIPIESMLGLIEKLSTTLRSLSLRSISLVREFSEAISMAEYEDSMVWPGFLLELQRYTHTLHDICFVRPQDEVRRGSGGATIGYVFQIEGRKFRGFSYSGADMKRALDGLHDSMTVWGGSSWYPELTGTWTAEDEVKAQHN